jgi:hypothetical protein
MRCDMSVCFRTEAIGARHQCPRSMFFVRSTFVHGATEPRASGQSGGDKGKGVEAHQLGRLAHNRSLLIDIIVNCIHLILHRKLVQHVPPHGYGIAQCKAHLCPPPDAPNADSPEAPLQRLVSTTFDPS